MTALRGPSDSNRTAQGTSQSRMWQAAPNSMYWLKNKWKIKLAHCPLFHTACTLSQLLGVISVQQSSTPPLWIWGSPTSGEEIRIGKYHPPGIFYVLKQFQTTCKSNAVVGHHWDQRHPALRKKVDLLLTFFHQSSSMTSMRRTYIVLRGKSVYGKEH